METEIGDVITTTEMNTAGDPVRIVESGLPKLSGQTLLERRKNALECHDHVRRRVILEPRGHRDMFGVLLQPADPGNNADMAALFIHADGYATMCGHASIALGRYLVDRNLVKTISEPETEVDLQAPCGMLKMYVEVNGGKTGGTRLITVPAFAFALDETLNVPGVGTIKVDVGFGGNFYVVVKDDVIGVDIHNTSMGELTRIGYDVTEAAKEQIKVTHPEHEELGFMFGTMILDSQDSYEPGSDTKHLSVTADKQVCRSPCGSGTTARIAVEYARGLIEVDVERTYISRATGSPMKGKVISETKLGMHDAVKIQLRGHGYYTGKCTFTVDKEDPLQNGFLLD